MALQHNFTHPNGVTAPEAYSRIERVHRLLKDKVSFQVDTYFTIDQRVDDYAPALQSESYEMEVTDGSVSWTSIYNYLKSLPEFDGAVDV